jgi:hypothetical protein
MKHIVDPSSQLLDEIAMEDGREKERNEWFFGVGI